MQKPSEADYGLNIDEALVHYEKAKQCEWSPWIPSQVWVQGYRNLDSVIYSDEHAKSINYVHETFPKFLERLKLWEDALLAWMACEDGRSSWRKGRSLEDIAERIKKGRET